MQGSTSHPPPRCTLAGFRNSSLSYSRLSRYEQCPLSFKLHYIDRKSSQPNDPMKFGKAVHATLERLVREAVDAEETGPLSEERAFELYRQEWARERLAGAELFKEGTDIVRSFVADEGVLDHQDVLALEKKFQLTFERFKVIGYIDRVDRVDDETVRVIDYKTNRVLFTRDEVASSLQLSLYHIAARTLWPWAKKVELRFHMLRQGIRLDTTRTTEDLQAARAYVITLGEQSETDGEYPAKLNTNCIYCDHRMQCPAYAEAVKGKREVVCNDLEDLELVAQEREEVATLAKILDSRKKELDKVLRAQLEGRDELVLAGVRYRMFNQGRTEYPLEPTLEMVSKASGLSSDEVRERIGAVDKKRLDALVKKLSKDLGKPRVDMLKAELSAVAKTSKSPRLWAKKEVA